MMKLFGSIFSVLAVVALIKATAASQLITLSDDNWSRSLEGEWMIKFYAPWCYACRAAKADFLRFSEWSEDLHMNVAEVDITKYPGLSGRFVVTALPTFYHAINGEFRRYTGERSADAFRDYVIDKQWATVKPISWFRHPNSILMTLMSWLFKASIILKELHELVTVTHGVPPWISYVFFIAATIATGLVFGMILVFIIEWIYPPKPEEDDDDDKAAAGDLEPAEEEKCEETEESSEESCEEEEVVDENEEAETCPAKAETSDEDAESEKDEIESSASDEKSNKVIEEDGDNISQDSQNSSQTFKSWERISETEVAESEGDEVRRRNVASRITEITEGCPKDEAQEVEASSQEPCKETEEENVKTAAAADAGDSGHTKAE